MVNQNWIKQENPRPRTCGNPLVFQANRYYSVTFSPQTIYQCAFSEFLYNFFKTKKGRIS